MNLIKELSYDIIDAGGVVRCHAMNYIYGIGLSDADEITELLKTCLDKGYLYSFFKHFYGDVGVFGSASTAKARRQLQLPFFTPRVLNGFFDIFYEGSVRLSQKLEPLAGTGPFAADQILGEWSFDTIIKTMGVSDNDNEVYSSKEFVEALKRSDDIIYNRIHSIWKHPDFMFKLTNNHYEANQMRKTIQKNSHKILEVLQRTMKHDITSDENTDKYSKKNVLEDLLRSGLSDEEISQELVVLILGTQLPSFALGYVLMLLGRYPSVQDRLNNELEEILGAARPVSRDDLPKLVYLDMVIKESLRLFPPAPVIIRRVLKDIMLPSGRVVPAGVEAMVSILGLHRDPKYWGPDAEHFDPDRFAPDRIRSVPANAYIPFSSGPRNCIGYRYGLMAMKVALCTVLRKYRIVGEPAPGPAPDIRTKYELFMKPLDDFTIQIDNKQ
ncbi:probable cytochrome P450 313a4 [Aricia agestis]|uniref:probable cytochrome P450 313a4 n=1 Tax=Aricia agestis TaxID=91739 RepID=UPI001C209B86|nr:probable cytochrome P450 313a4 [Aricia agestis]